MNKYNSDIKERFMDYIDINKYPPGYWERLFDKSSRFEEKNGKDLYDFTASEIIEFYKFMDLGNISGVTVLNSNIIKYTQWALIENLISDNQIHAIEISKELLYSCINQQRMNKSLITYEQLSSIHWLNMVDAFIVWCLFEGIKGTNYEEIINIKLSDINDKNEIKLCTGRTVKVSNKFVWIANEADQEEEYVTFGTDRSKPLKQSVFIYKEKSNARSVDVPRGVYAALSRNLYQTDGLNNNMSARSLRDSGLIHYLNKRAEDLKTTVKSLFATPDSIKDILDKYQFNLSVKVRFLEMYKDYLK